jgi:putative membrane protein
VHVPDEPDPRFTLANERTFLAWVRTVLAVLAGSVALHTLEVPDPPWLRRTLVGVLLVFGAVMMLAAQHRWHAVDRAIRQGQPLPRFTMGTVTTAAVVVTAVLLVVAFV